MFRVILKTSVLNLPQYGQSDNDKVKQQKQRNNIVSYDFLWIRTTCDYGVAEKSRKPPLIFSKKSY